MPLHRIQWPFSDPNMLGAMAASLAVIGFIVSLKSSPRWAASLGGIMALMFGIMIFLTQSRAAAISAFLVTSVCYLLTERKRRLWGIALMGTFGIVMASLGFLRPENVLTTGGSINTRLEIYRHVPDLIGGTPWGIGESGITTGAWYSRYLYNGPVEGLSLSTLVNSHLDALVRYGWVIGSIMVGCLALAWVCALMSFRRNAIYLQVVSGVFLCLFMCGMSSHIFRDLTLYGTFVASTTILVAYASSVLASPLVGILPMGTGLWYGVSVILGNMTPFRLLESELSVLGANPMGPSVSVRDGRRWGNMGREIRRAISMIAHMQIQIQESGMTSWTIQRAQGIEGVTYHFDDGQSPLSPLHEAGGTQVLISGTLLRKHHFRVHDAESMGYLTQPVPGAGSYYVSWFQCVIPGLAEYSKDNQ